MNREQQTRPARLWAAWPAILSAACIAALVLTALAWYPPVLQRGYAPVNPAPLVVPNPGRVSINTAGEAELMSLPGIGEKRARAIIDYRMQNGPFTAPEGLLEVSGIGPKILEGIRELISL